MKSIFLVALFAVTLTFALSAAADDGNTQEPNARQAAQQDTQETDQTVSRQHPAATKGAAAPAPHINAKSLYDGSDYDGGGDADDTGQTDGGQKVLPARAPTGSSGDMPYSDDEMRQADPSTFSPSNKNMPVDQD